jgi:preprotein translocase subunit YajC
MNILYVMLQAQGAPSGAGGSGLIMIILLFVVMWLLMIRPQNKKAKEEAKMREQLKKGDRVSFSGGIYGKVHEVAEHTIDVEIANGVVVTVEKSMVQPIPEQPAANAKK